MEVQGVSCCYNSGDIAFADSFVGFPSSQGPIEVAIILKKVHTVLILLHMSRVSCLNFRLMTISIAQYRLTL